MTPSTPRESTLEKRLHRMLPTDARNDPRPAVVVVPIRPVGLASPDVDPERPELS